MPNSAKIKWRKALQDHVDLEDKKDGVTIRDSIGRNQKPTVINESGLYSLILSSKMTNVKKFKRGVIQNFTNVYTDTVVNNGGI